MKKLIIYFFMLTGFQSALFGQETDSLAVSKHQKAYTIIEDVKPEEKNWVTTNYLGGQIGYSRFKANQFDLGLNYYWSKMKRRDRNDPKNRDDIYHTFGPFVAGLLLLKPTTTIAGTQIGIDYHYYYSICPRINVSYENYFNGDQRIGADAGFSVAGIFAYIGYHYPVGAMKSADISNFRFGFRFVFNQALIDTMGMNWN